jgi:hypothetical protein
LTKSVDDGVSEAGLNAIIGITADRCCRANAADDIKGAAVGETSKIVRVAAEGRSAISAGVCLLDGIVHPDRCWPGPGPGPLGGWAGNRADSEQSRDGENLGEMHFELGYREADVLERKIASMWFVECESCWLWIYPRKMKNVNLEKLERLYILSAIMAGGLDALNISGPFTTLRESAAGGNSRLSGTRLLGHWG